MSWDEAFASRYEEWSAHMTDDVGFYVGLAQEADGPVVELAVGNGRVAIPVALATQRRPSASAPPRLGRTGVSRREAYPSTISMPIPAASSRALLITSGHGMRTLRMRSGPCAEERSHPRISLSTKVAPVKVTPDRSQSENIAELRRAS